MKQEKWITGIICLLVIFCAGCFYLYHGQKTTGQDKPFQPEAVSDASGEPSDRQEQKTGQSETPAEYAVYICGAVKHPGVYRFTEVARVCDVVEAAGGFTQNAAEASVNQARYIADGEQIEILSRKQWKKSQGQGIASSDHPTDGQDDGKININTATETELMALSGVGPSKAKAIIEYRTQNGTFASVENIMQVPGIKEGVYDQIKDSITV